MDTGGHAVGHGGRVVVVVDINEDKVDVAAVDDEVVNALAAAEFKIIRRRKRRGDIA